MKSEDLEITVELVDEYTILLSLGIRVSQQNLTWPKTHLEFRLFTSPNLIIGQAEEISRYGTHATVAGQISAGIVSVAKENTFTEFYAKKVAANPEGRFLHYVVHLPDQVAKDDVYYYVIIKLPLVDKQQNALASKWWLDLGYEENNTFKSVHITPPTHFFIRAQSNYLHKLKRESFARCRASWESLGLSNEESLALVEDLSVGDVRQEYQPSEEKPLIILQAPVGAGKSLIVERILQNIIGQALTEPEVPLPVYFDRVENERILNIVKRDCWGIGDPEIDGVYLIIDKFENVDPLEFDEIVKEVRYIIKLFPKSRAIITSRPILSPHKYSEIVNVSPLPEEQVIHLIQQATNDNRIRFDEWMLSRLPDSLKEAVTRPLFAILFGIYRRQNWGNPRYGTDLLRYFLDNALSTVHDQSATDVTYLMCKLATLSITSGRGAIPLVELSSDNKAVQKLRNTKLVMGDNNAVQFTLPIVMEWFAAEALAHNMIPPSEIIGDGRQLSRWYQAIHTLISNFSHEQVSQFLEPLVNKEPLIAARLVSSAISRGESSSFIPSVTECQQRLSQSILAWSNGLDPLLQAVGPVNPKDFDVGVDDSQTRLFTEWRYEYISRTRSGYIAPQSAWAWKWTAKEISTNLANALKNRELPTDNTFLKIETLWKIFALLSNSIGNAYAEPIPIQQLEFEINRIAAAMTYYNIGEKGSYSIHAGGTRLTFTTENIKMLQEYLGNYATQGVINPPWPTIARSVNTRTFMYDILQESVLDWVTFVYMSALDTYQQIVTTWFPRVATRMRISATLPARLVGNLYGNSTFRLSWYLDPLEHHEDTRVEIRLNDIHFDEGNHITREVFTRLQQLRPEASLWIGAQLAHQYVNFATSTPVTDIVYDWLERDLEDILKIN